MNLLLWGTEIDDRFFPTLELIKEIGFDGVEVPVHHNKPEHWFKFRAKLDSLDLLCETDTFCGAEHNLISPDANVRRRAVTYLKGCLDCSLVLGASKLMGPLHSALGTFTGNPATELEWNYAVEGIREVADYAESLDIVLGMEYLNRFELYLTSSTQELLDFVKAVNHPNCRVMFDTFHANIEEKNVGDAIRLAKDQITFIQLSENDRSTPGAGNVDWDGVFAAIKEINYDGWLSIEAFGLKLPAANIWRKMYHNEHQLMREGLAFIKAGMMDKA
ncbi:sugar phosphate isomerase/epimerase family protein [Dyadobacter jejuensis]|nr:sugar phosphate isomerase/epimerase family protein [Dyadobacter jejuensis]